MVPILVSISTGALSKTSSIVGTFMSFFHTDSVTKKNSADAVTFCFHGERVHVRFFSPSFLYMAACFQLREP